MASLFKKQSAPFRVKEPEVLLPRLAEEKQRLADLRAREPDLYRKANPKRDVRYRDGKTVAQLVDEAASGKPFEPGRIRGHEELVAEARAEHAVVEAAVTRLTGVVEASKREASKLVCEDARVEFLARANRLVATLRAAHSAHLEMQEIKDQLDALDVAWTGHLPNVSATSLLGGAREPDSKIQYFLCEAAASGVTGEAK